MPYRRLPNTDISRIRALKKAIEKSSSVDFMDVALSMNTLNEAKSIVYRFERLTLRYQQTFDTQVKANIAFKNKVKAARLYISHFIQVLYMSVLRSEIKTQHLEFYNLQKLDLTLPELNTNEQILEWGEKIISGEKMRIEQGGVPIYNPSIAKTKVMYAQFRDGYKTQKIHQNATNRMQEEVSNYRKFVDDIILKIWDEVEIFNLKFDSDLRLDKNREYGIIYYYRKGELINNRDD